jgi:hypothetical protein
MSDIAMLKQRVFVLENQINKVQEVLNGMIRGAEMVSNPVLTCGQCNICIYSGHSCSQVNCINGLNPLEHEDS